MRKNNMEIYIALSIKIKSKILKTEATAKQKIIFKVFLQGMYTNYEKDFKFKNLISGNENTIFEQLLCLLFFFLNQSRILEGVW